MDVRTTLDDAECFVLKAFETDWAGMAEQWMVGLRGRLIGTGDDVAAPGHFPCFFLAEI